MPSTNKPLKPVENVRGFIAEWTVTALLLLFGTTTILQAFVVPSGSMEGTLLVGDHLFVDKLTYSPSGPISKHLLPYQDVKRGDIIVFRYPPDIKQNYVKRVIGIPGDHIRLENKQVILKGRPLEEPYVQHIKNWVDPYVDNFPSTPNIPLTPGLEEMLTKHVVGGELVVPEGHYFAVGDNRDNSSDSRFWGLVPRENIIGKPVIIYWSFDAPGEALANGNIDLDHILDIATNFFTKTRWNRTFHLVRPVAIP